MMDVYLNDQSLHRQYKPDTVQEQLKMLISCLRVLESCKPGGLAMSYNPTDFYCRPVYEDNTQLQSYLNQHKELKKRLKLGLKNFVPVYASGACKYKDIVFDKTILGVVYQSALSRDTTIVNLPLSIFVQPSVCIQHEKSVVEVGSYDNVDDLRHYLVKKGLLTKSYDINSGRSPHDDETILADTTLFEQTRHSYQGRKMYRRLGTCELWYVDNLHYGQDAHLEVFNENTKEQIAVSAIDKISCRDPKGNERGRRLRFDGEK